MPFMLLILVVLLGLVLWGFFHSDPRGVGRAGLLACNATILLLALLGAGAAASLLYGDAVTVKSAERGMATYLAIMAGGTVFMIVLAVGGMLRNLVIFPPGRRAPAPPEAVAD